MLTQAKIVIIGGGAVGSSILYHFCLRGENDVLLLERDELTSGSTWHAAGNIPTFSGSWNILKLQYYSAQLYKKLAQDPQYPINYHITGSIRLAHTTHRMEEFAHVKAMAAYQEIDYKLLDIDQMGELYPGLQTHDLQGGLWDPHDGDIDPSQLTQAFCSHARVMGGQVERFCGVQSIAKRLDGKWALQTTKGEIVAETVINAAGFRGAEVAAMVGQHLPVVSMQHQYLVTETIDSLDVDNKLPLLRDPDDSYYLRQERDGLLLGPYEWQATPEWANGIPDDFAMGLYEDDLDRLEWYIESACARVPLLGTVGVQRVINGPIPYSPDGLPLMGPAHDRDNFFHCCSFSFGIAQAGGAGKIMAEWVLDGCPQWDMWAVDSRRYGAYATQKYVTDKAVEIYQNEYAIAYPNEERPAGRPARTTPCYAILRDKGAVFGARAGMERAMWFATPDQDPTNALSFHRTNWFDNVRAECEAVQNSCGILDLGGFAKFEISGDNATQWLQSRIAGKTPKLGRSMLGYILSDEGGVLSEVTLTQLRENHYLAISAGAAEYHDWDVLRAGAPQDHGVTINNVTNNTGCLVLAGPKARDILQQVTTNDLSNKAFPWMSARTITIGFCDVLALRVNYVGELGWELHMPMVHQLAVYEALMEAGASHGLKDFGMYAMDSLRIEKCYRGWKADLVHEYSALMSSLDRFVDLDKPDFPGRTALLKEKQQGLQLCFMPMIVDSDDVSPLFCSTVHDGDDIVGLVTAGGYGHRVGSTIALAYLNPQYAKVGTKLSIDIVGARYNAVVTSEPIYDPKNEKLRS